MGINIVGEKVIHNKYGQGIIVAVENEKWQIDFQGIIKTIAYSVVLGKVLKFEDITIMTKILEDKNKRENIHNSIWKTSNIFLYILELCQHDKKQLSDAIFVEELVQFFSSKKDMSDAEKNNLEKALKIISNKSFEAFPIYPVIMINTHSKEGERYYAQNIMDAEYRNIELTYLDKELQEAINIIISWCVISKQIEVKKATEISKYMENETKDVHFCKSVACVLKKVFEDNKHKKYFEKVKEPLQIGYDFYLGDFCVIDECYKYWDEKLCIGWGGFTECGTGSDVSITYILPLIE